MIGRSKSKGPLIASKNLNCPYNWLIGGFSRERKFPDEPYH